jgi:hypothetical protein
MNINHVPVSPHNAKAWELNEIDIDMTLRCPDQNGVLTICDYSEAQTKLASLSLTALDGERGFIAERTDNIAIQAQYVRPHKSYDPNGRNVFVEPVEFVPVYHDFVTDRWRIDVDPENVADLSGLNTLVWALAHYGLKRKNKLLASVEN